MSTELNNAPVEILIVRHGETRHNELGILQGQFDSELNDLGRRQAAAAGESLRGMEFTCCYSSDLRRTMETAEIIRRTAGLNMQILPETGLREWNLGIFQNRTHKELCREYPELMNSFKRECEDVQVPGGESRAEFRERVAYCLKRIAAAHKPGEKIMLVTHGGGMQMILRAVVGPVARENITPLASNASISQIRYFPHVNSFQLVSWNETSHLRRLDNHATMVY